MADEHLARSASQRSVHAVQAKRKDDWLALFADDAVIEDPVGASPIDPSGKGQRGRAAISAFWDAQIAPNQVRFELRESYASGQECANVATITITMPNGMRARVDGVFVYRVNDAGKLISLRAFWEFDRMMASLAPS